MKGVLIGMQTAASERNFKGIGSRRCIRRNHTSFCIMEVWTKQDIYNELMSNKKIVDGVEFIPIEKLAEILTDARIPESLIPTANQILQAYQAYFSKK
ncbi:hypothetical protein AAA214_05825 [Parabacteroides goldsteinii]|uniref:hypothetical protein n=1 Tax=Parabacteroides goldsteinii TaxID=328812 RepID=UPI00321BC91E